MAGLYRVVVDYGDGLTYNYGSFRYLKDANIRFVLVRHEGDARLRLLGKNGEELRRASATDPRDFYQRIREGKIDVDD